MKKLITVILSFYLTTNLSLHSMQSCLNSQLIQSAESNKKIAIRITGTSDGIDVVIPEKSARASKYFSNLLNSASNSTLQAQTSSSQTPETREKGVVQLKYLFSSSDLDLTKSYLDKIVDGNGAYIFQTCHFYPISINIKQLLIADFYEIETLKQAQIIAIARKYNTQFKEILLHQQDSLLRELIQSIPENLQKNILETISILSMQPRKLCAQYGKIQGFSLTFSPDYNFAVSVCNERAQLWNTGGGQLLCELNGKNNFSIIDCAFLPANRIAIATIGPIYIWNGNNGKLLNTLENIPDPKNMVYPTNRVAAFSPDGSRIVVGTSDGDMKLYDSISGKLLSNERKHTNEIRHAEFSRDGSCFITTSDDGTACVWNSNNGKLSFILKEHKFPIGYASFSPDGNSIVTGDEKGILCLWKKDGNAYQLLRTTKAHNDKIRCIKFSPDGNQFATTSSDTSVCLCNSNNGELLQTMQGHSTPVYSASFSRDGKLLVTVSRKEAIVWDVKTKKIFHNLKVRANWCRKGAFLNDREIIISFVDGTVERWDVNTGKLLYSLGLHNENVLWTEFDKKGKSLVAANRNGYVQIWDTNKGKLLLNEKKHTGQVNYATFSNNGNYIATASSDGVSCLFNAKDNLPLLSGHTDSVSWVAFSPNDNFLITTSNDKTAKIYEKPHIYNDGYIQKPLHILQFNCGVSHASFSPDENRVVTTCTDGTAHIWRTLSGRLLHSLVGGSHYNINHTLFSPDGKYVATASSDCNAYIYDSENGQLLYKLEGHRGPVIWLDFSPDGKRILTASYDKTAKIWNAENGRLLLTLNGHTDLMRCAKFSPDGNFVLTASFDKTAKVWDAHNGQLLNSLEEHTDSLTCATFSPVGKYVATTSFDGTVCLWKPIIDPDNNCQTLSQALFLLLIHNYKKNGETLDLDDPKKKYLKNIFETFEPKQQKDILKTMQTRIKCNQNSSKNHSNSSAAASDI